MTDLKLELHRQWIIRKYKIIMSVSYRRRMITLNLPKTEPGLNINLFLSESRLETSVSLQVINKIKVNKKRNIVLAYSWCRFI